MFCLRWIAKPFSLAECSADEATQFAKKLAQLCQAEWDTIAKSPREGLGHEKMPVDQIRAKLPPRVTKDVSELLVFRFGGIARILGLRHDRVFEVYLIDPKGQTYGH